MNQYTITWGTPEFREAIAGKVARTYPGWEPDPHTEIVVTCGATEGMAATHIGLLDAGDEVVIFEPWYEEYGPHSIITGTTPKLVTLREPDWTFDEAELRAAFGPRTRAVILNTPHNPTGKMFDANELALISELCNQWDCYRDLRRDLRAHPLPRPRRPHPAGTRPRPRGPHGHAERHVEDLRRHRLAGGLGHRQPHPHGGDPQGPRLPDGERTGAAAGGRHRRHGLPALRTTSSWPSTTWSAATLLCNALEKAGFGVRPPAGAYYVMADTSHVDPDGDDTAFSMRLIKEFGVGAVPGSSFYADVERGKQARKMRFAFPKKLETLQLAAERLARLGG